MSTTSASPAATGIRSTMYEESAGIPMIMAGPEVPAGKVCDTPVTLADGFPTFIHALGARPDPRDRVRYSPPPGAKAAYY